jgi:glycosyltransferase involved in cell wall biosynthesis
MKTVGWPLAVAEAQASGVGVCIANMRPDLKEYVGEAGYLYNSIEELKEIVSKPFSPEKRELGFKLAERSNFTERVSELTALWDKAKPGGLARFLKFFKAAS